MRYLLDTNVLVFMLCAPQELSDEARRVVQNDRLLVAQVLDEGLAIVTRDRAIPRYPVQAVW